MKTFAFAALLSALPLAVANPPWGGPPHGGHPGRPGGPGGPGGYGGGHGGPQKQCTGGPPSGYQGGAGPAVLTSDIISTMGNNSLFTRWRPTSHFQGPAGWMNDPCGAMYDPTRDEYHLFYQWHPNHINWGNISWGYAKSKDGISWVDHKSWHDNDALALWPQGNGTYNGLGIFSGTGQPVNLQGEVDGTLTLFYTSVSYLPTNWRIYYQPYTETQSFAQSYDGGDTWVFNPDHPVINATTNTAPMYWNLTGHRDPFFEPWPEMDVVLQKSAPHYYAVLGSGIKGVGPRMPLWSAPASDLEDWTFEGALWEPADNSSLGPVYSTATYGFNFEVSGFFSIKDSKGADHYYVNMGTEGNNLTWHPRQQWALWNEGIVSRRANGSAAFEPIAGGAGDWGLGYALTSFMDTKHNRRLQYAWVQEDYPTEFVANQQGYQGSLSLARHLFVHEVANVVSTPELVESKSARLYNTGNGVVTAMVLGKKVAEDVLAALRACSKKMLYKACKAGGSRMLNKKTNNNYELTGSILSSSGSAGFIVGASPNMEEYTVITYEPSNHTILIDRSHSSLIDEFANFTVEGYFYPYTIQGKGQEPITFDIFLDGSLLEVYVNDRFAASTRIYPSMDSSTGYGLYAASGSAASFSDVNAYIGLANSFPERPANSSSKLVYDTPEQTNNYIWWPGN